MATIDQDIAQVRTAIYGRDVREAIADGLEHVKTAIQRSDDVIAAADRVIAQTQNLGLSVVNGKINITFNT